MRKILGVNDMKKIKEFVNYVNVEKKRELKKDIRDYCRKHRYWAAMDSNKQWFMYSDKPILSSVMWGKGSLRISVSDFVFPNIPWNKSLIAPDGSMPLMEPEKPKEKGASKPEIGKWYTAKEFPERGAGQLKEISSHHLPYLLYHPTWDGGHNGCYVSKNFYYGNHCLWYSADEIEECPAPAKWKPKRGDPKQRFTKADKAAMDKLRMMDETEMEKYRVGGGCVRF